MISEDTFPTIVFQKDHQFYCAIKELSILECGADLLQTYEAAQRKKIGILKQYAQANLEPILIQGRNEWPSKRRFWNRSLNFATICFFLMIPTMTLLQPITRILNRIESFTELKPSEMIVKLSDRVEKMEENEKIALRNSIHLLLEEFQTPSEQNSER